jgi:hypothetical protein
MCCSEGLEVFGGPTARPQHRGKNRPLRVTEVVPPDLLNTVQQEVMSR